MKKIFLTIILFSQMLVAEEVAVESVSTPKTSTVVAANAQAESEIPLTLEPKKATLASEGLAGKVIYSFVILLALGAGIFFLIKRNSIPKSARSQAQIKVLSQHYFGPKRSVAMIRVAGESMLIGITDQNINLVKSLSLLDEDVPEDVADNFSKALTKKISEEGRWEQAEAQGEEFSFSGIKDIVNKKLQGMRDI